MQAERRLPGALRRRRSLKTDLPARFRLAAGPAQLVTIDPCKTSVINLKGRREVHGIGMTADDVGEMPAHGALCDVASPSRMAGRLLLLISEPPVYMVNSRHPNR